MQKTKLKKRRAALSAFATLTIPAVISATLTGCSPGFNSSNSEVAKQLDESLGCKDFEDKLWSAFAKSVEDTGRPPGAGEIQAALGFRLKNASRLGKMSEASKAQVSKLTGGIATTIALRNEKGLSVANTQALDEDSRRGLWLERVAQLEIGDRTTDEKSQDVDAVRAQIAELKALAQREGLVEVACAAQPITDGENTTTPATPTPSAASSMFDSWKSTVALPVYGGLKTVSTIYQSCEAATRAPLGSDVANVQGITVTGRHSSGTGNVRKITNLKSFLSTQPYIGTSAYKRPLPTCYDVQAVPSIYDYGGKPYASTANEKVLNLFKNGGTGSTDLGIDCSALVYTSYATVGLKFKKESALKATLVNGVSSTMLTEPQKNGLTCLDHAKFVGKTNLQAGDIIAIKGHVVMVADVGADPFGIDSFTSVSQCKTSNISIGKFNFTIFQSSPEKGGIGVNRMKASYYLSPASTMGKGMIDHAVNACKAKFQTAAITTKSTSASVVRHLGTAACADASPVKLTQEECLSSCSARSLD